MDLNYLLDVPVEIWVIVVLALTSLFTSALTAAFGLGGGTVLIAVMAAVLPAFAVIPMHTASLFSVHFSRTLLLREHIAWRHLRYYALGTLLGSLVGVGLWYFLPPTYIKLFIAIFLLWNILKSVPGFPRFPEIKAAHHIMGTLIGFFAASMGGLFSATGPVVMVFVRTGNFVKQGTLATHATAMGMQSTLRLGGIIVLGFPFIQWLPVLIPILIASQIGTKLGLALINHISEAFFTKALNSIMIIITFFLFVQLFYTEFLA